MTDKLTVSAKALGELTLETFCPRCFWLKLKARKLPWQIIPGIFSTIDSYTKKIMSSYFHQQNILPYWLQQLAENGNLVKVPHYSKSSILDGDTNIELRGVPDVLIEKDGEYVIIDYKTARLTKHQDKILPMYEVQLNAYAYIAQRCGHATVSKVYLLYFEPQTDVNPENVNEHISDQGFGMTFTAKALELKLNPEALIPPLLRQTRKLADMKYPPDPADKCEDCRRLDGLVELVGEK